MSVNFRSKFHLALLSYYFSNPGKAHYVRELSKILSFDAAHLSRELKLLTRSGLFFTSARGREKYFRINQNHPLYSEFKKIIQYIVDKKSTKRNRLEK